MEFRLVVVLIIVAVVDLMKIQALKPHWVLLNRGVMMGEKRLDL